MADISKIKALNGTVYDIKDATARQNKTKLGTITFGTTWSGSDPYTQTVTVASTTVTSYSKVDMQPDAAILGQLVTDGVTAMYIENDNGTLTAYAIGAAPTTAMTVQCSVSEVE